MTNLILDTHALVWFLQKDRQLSKKALKAILDDHIYKIIPLIALCEIQYLYHRGRFATSVEDLLVHLQEAKNFEIVGHSPDQIPYLQADLDIHDNLIVATALFYQNIHHKNVKIVTRDEAIQRYSPVPFLW